MIKIKLEIAILNKAALSSGGVTDYPNFYFDSVH